ncbi:hypothetical protein GCM10007916_34570 [Psychromonas marina]|uniref:Uncharacterized protein n=1 Tax=Psychromonas marina TaxID=88364 RepID=A0ABQ6E5V1_9GAMM|nr:hypothetical protein [Psychromonas marina]GLS92386.1 hypothetical protein GCM10007916_34570 [Psychromonas marina]
MKNLIKTTIIASLFTIAGVQAQSFCEGSSACLGQNEVPHVAAKHVTVKTNSHQQICSGAAACKYIVL